RAGLDSPHRVLVEADRVPLAELDDLVLDLDARRPADDDVDLLLALVLVAERDAEPGRERDQAQAERLAADGRPGEAGLELRRHAELRRLVLHLTEVLLRVSADGSILIAPAASQTSAIRSSPRTRLTGMTPGGASSAERRREGGRMPGQI